MSKGKYSKNRGLNLRPIVLMLAVALLVGATIGGTIAWLTAQTPDVTNTFTVGDVDLTLMETPLTFNDDGTVTEETKAENVTNTYPMIPGTTYKKDPTVTVDADSEDCYLFVKFEEINNPSLYLNYESLLKAPDWTAGTGEEGNDIPTNVWYREVKKTDPVKSWNLLNKKAENSYVDGYIAVKDTVVKAGTNTEGTSNVAMPAAENAPSLKYTAYAVQKANLTVEQAWEKVAP